MTDPDWLIRARAEGRVISETGVFCRPSGSLPVEDFGAKVALVPKAVSGLSAKPRENKPSPIPPTSRLSLVVTIMGLRLASESNMGGTLRGKIARKSEVKDAVREAIGRAAPLLLPLTVTLTRLGSKSLDGDNLQRAMKAVRDVVAEWIGVDDADKGIKWRYQQKPAYRMGCRICVRERR